MQNAIDDWNRRVQERDLPWFTSQESGKSFQELHYLKSYDRERKEWRDLQRLEFRREVLDKYDDNELCAIDNDSISFLRKDRKTPVSTVHFQIKESDVDTIIIDARDFIIKYLP